MNLKLGPKFSSTRQLIWNWRRLMLFWGGKSIRSAARVSYLFPNFYASHCRLADIGGDVVAMAISFAKMFNKVDAKLK
jgi:hypothetical protein